MALTKEPPAIDENESWYARIYDALRKLDDRLALNRSPLARLACVEKLAREKYGGRVQPRGLALRELLLASIERTLQDLGEEPANSRACRYLVLMKQGLSCRQIAIELGLSREHVSRLYRRKALELVTSVFLSAIKHSR